MATGPDKRKQARVPVELWIEVTLDGELYFQRASNLSVGGVFFTQTIPLPLGTRVALSFELPFDASPVRCEGDIVTAKDFGMGVSFVGLSAADRKRVQASLSALEGRTQPPLKTPTT